MVKPIQFPVIGNSMAMAIFILVHVFFAFIAVGGIVIAFVSELIGYRKGSRYHDLLARKYMTFISNLMKIGGVLGTAIVVLLIGLFPGFTTELFNIFFWFLVLEVAGFLALFSGSVYYRETWGREDNKRQHLFIGGVTAFAAVLSAFIINAANAFMLTPGNYLKHPDPLTAAMNPTAFSSFPHLIIPCVINAALLFYFYSLFKLRKALPEERPFHEWALGYTGTIAASFILLQPLSGILFLFKVRSVDETIFAKIVSGNVAIFFWHMVALASIAVISSMIFLFSGRRARMALVVAGLAVFLAFPMGGFTRERARKPYLIYGYMYMNQRLVADAEASKPGNKTDTAVDDGDQLLERYDCFACHKFKGRGGTLGRDITNLNYSEDRIREILKSPPEDMPPFEGSEGEMDKLAEILSRRHK